MDKQALTQTQTQTQTQSTTCTNMLKTRTHMLVPQIAYQTQTRCPIAGGASRPLLRCAAARPAVRPHDGQLPQPRRRQADRGHWCVGRDEPRRANACLACQCRTPAGPCFAPGFKIADLAKLKGLKSADNSGAGCFCPWHCQFPPSVRIPVPCKICNWHFKCVQQL